MKGRNRTVEITPTDLRTKDTVHGEVITYMLSPEELARYRAMPLKEYVTSNGTTVAKPIRIKTKGRIG